MQVKEYFHRHPVVGDVEGDNVGVIVGSKDGLYVGGYV